MKRLTQLFVLVAFMLSCGGQWYLLQGIAWTSMIREYSQVVPFTQAVQMTFSGQYPCSLCKAIAEKKQSEDSKILSLGKYEKKAFSPALAVTQPFRSISSMTYIIHNEFFQTRSEAPPTPPPRFA